MERTEANADPGASPIPGGQEAQRDAGVPGARRKPLVVVNAQGAARSELAATVDRFPDHEVHVLAGPDELAQLDPVSLGALAWGAVNDGQVNWCLRMIGSPSVIVDIAPGDEARHHGTWNRAFLHLAADGQYVVPRTAFTTTADFEAWSRTVLLLRSCALGVPGAELSDRDRRLAAFVGGARADEDSTAVVKRVNHVIKLRDLEATRIVATRVPEVHVAELETRPAVTFSARGRTFNHGNRAPIAGMDTAFEVPARRVRSYEGPDVRVVERCLATVGNLVIPESFRFHLEKNLNNPRLTDVDPEFATINNDWNASWDYLPGSYYHLDASNSGHFGHLMTEVLSKLWGWTRAKAEIPDLKAIFRIRQPGEREPRLELEIFGAFGISPDDIVWTGAPVRVDRLVAATPQWHNQFPYYVDPDISETWERMGATLVRPDASGPEKIFVSRKPALKNRACRNTPEVERYFESQGFTILYPEDLTLTEQATVFANARVVAGFGGSALFNVGFAKRLEALIVLNHEAYTARNEHLYGAVLGCDVHFFWSAPDVPHPAGGWSEEAYFSNWGFETDRLRSELGALLGSL